ncbi:hypothetical protein LTS17_012594 [Exophiala oligosperma]
MEEEDDLIQMAEDDLWMNAIRFDPFDLVGLAPTAHLTWELYEKRLKELSRTLHPDKISLFYCQDERVILGDLPWPRQHHVNLLRGYMSNLSEEARGVSFTRMKYFWRQYSVSTWNAGALIAHGPVAIVLQPDPQYYPRALRPRNHVPGWRSPTQKEIDDGLVDDSGAWKNESGRKLFPDLKAYSPYNNPRHNREHSEGHPSSIRVTAGPSAVHDSHHPTDSGDTANLHPGMSHRSSDNGAPRLYDHSHQGRRGESAQRPILLVPRRRKWHPRMAARPDQPTSLARFRPRIIPREESMTNRIYRDETGFFNQVLHPFEYRDAKINNVRVKLADVFVGTVPAATGTPAAVYASWTAKGFSFHVLGRSPSGNKVALLRTASGPREREVPFEEILLEGGWIGATEDWIRYRTWELQPRMTRKLL